MIGRRLRIDRALHDVTLEVRGEEFTLREGERVVSGRRRWAGARLTLEVEGRVIEAHVTRDARGTLELWLGSERYAIEEERGGGGGAVRGTGDADEDELTAPMPAKIVRVHVAAGDPVESGQPLVVLESMKMEMSVTAPRPGRVRRVGPDVVPGAIVTAGTLLVELEPAGADGSAT